MNFKELKQKIKQEQKKLASNIRIGKFLRKPKNYEKASKEDKNHSDWVYNSNLYRHRHIIYCQFFHNTPYEKIEKKCKEEPNSNWLKKIEDSWKSQLDEIVCDNQERLK
jgi:hypothetical protein